MTDIDVRVSYSLPEMLTRMDGKLDSVVAALATKVDRTEHTALNERVTVLEADKANRDNSRDSRRWLIPVLAAIVVGLLGTCATLITATLH
jgi:hypothetical protein